MTRGNPWLPRIPLVVQRYGLAVSSVAIALGVGLFLSGQNIKDVEFPIFLIAIALTVWYAGIGPAIVALVLASLAFNYYFTQPRYTFYVNTSDWCRRAPMRRSSTIPRRLMDHSLRAIRSRFA